MGENEIIVKLKKILDTNLDEECQVMYLLVEARKVNFKRRNTNYPWIRFYRDWAVHTSKDEPTKEIKAVMEEIYDEIILKTTQKPLIIHGPKIPGFTYMENLRQEIGSFLRENGLADSLIEPKKWDTFVHTLAKVLADQPITNAHPKIKSFSFDHTNDGHVRGRVEYQKEDGTEDVLTFGEVNINS